MADKHHSGRKTKKMQRELEKEMAKSLGMPENSKEYEKAAIIFDNALDVKEKAKIMIGRIQNQMDTLDRDSNVRNEYQSMLNDNQKYIDEIEKWTK